MTYIQGKSSGEVNDSTAGDMKNPLLNVPKLDYRQLMGGKLKGAIYEALKEYAFFYITDIPGLNAENEMRITKNFFSQSKDVKLRYASVKHNSDNANVFRGYGFVDSLEGCPIEEAYNVGQFDNRSCTVNDVSCRAEFISREPNVWPGKCDFDGSHDFQSTLTKGFDIRMNLARKISDDLGEVLNFAEFPLLFKDGEFTSLYLKRYGIRNPADNVNVYYGGAGYAMQTEDGKDLAVPSHIDTTITLLATYNNSGLQAMYKDNWYDVPSIMGSLMLMSGDLIEELTDGKLPCLRHRVLDIKEDRYSMPFFYNLSFNADISKSQNGKDTKAGQLSSTYGPWQVVQLHRDETLILNDGSLN